MKKPFLTREPSLSAHPERSCAAAKSKDRCGEKNLRLLDSFIHSTSALRAYAQDERRECDFFHEVALGSPRPWCNRLRLQRRSSSIKAKARVKRVRSSRTLSTCRHYCLDSFLAVEHDHIGLLVVTIEGFVTILA